MAYGVERLIPARGDFRLGLCMIGAVYPMPKNLRFIGLNPACSSGHVLMMLEMHKDVLQNMTEDQNLFLHFLRSQASFIRR